MCSILILWPNNICIAFQGSNAALSRKPRWRQKGKAVSNYSIHSVLFYIYHFFMFQSNTNTLNHFIATTAYFYIEFIFRFKYQSASIYDKILIMNKNENKSYFIEILVVVINIFSRNEESTLVLFMNW